MTRPCAWWKVASRTGAISRSGVTKPGTSALVESLSSRSMPSAPSRAKPPRSVSRPSSGHLVHLEVAGVQDQAGVGTDRDREGVRDRVVDREELALERAEVARSSPSATCCSTGLIRCSLQLGLDQGEGEPRADQRDVRALAQQVRHRADVVLVAVGEHDRLDVVEAVPQVGEVRQDQVDAGLVLLREQHPAVDDRAAGRRTRRRSCCGRSRRARRGRSRAGRPPGRAGGGPSSGCGWLTGCSCRRGVPARSRGPPRRHLDARWSVASTSGSRTGPAGRPCARSPP